MQTEGSEEKFDMDKSKKSYPWKGVPIWLDQRLYPNYQESLYTFFDNRISPNYGVAVFKKSISLKKDVSRILCWITGDCKYRFYLDGKFVGLGPTITGGDYGNRQPMSHWYYDRYEYIPSGRRISLFAEVVLQPAVQAEYSMGRGCLIADLEIYYADGTVEIVGSDDTWLCGLDYRYEADGLYNGRHSMEFSHAVSVENRWNLLPREIPNLMHWQVKPVQYKNPFYQDRVHVKDKKIVVRPGSPVSFWLEFDRTYAGYILLNAEENPGVHIEICIQEILGRTDRREKIILGEGRTSYHGLKMQSIHYLNVVISEITRELTLDICVDATEYPVLEEGEFHCSDECLNSIYDLGKWTLRICRQDYHMDSPIHQETLGCTGDYMIESLINYYTFGDKYLTRKDILRTAAWLRKNDYQMFHTSYSLMWIQMLKDYYWYTGDDSLFAECFEEVEGLLRRFGGYVGSHGLIENPPNYMFMDWVPVGRYNLHHPPKVLGMGYMTALYYQALVNGQFIAEYLKKHEKAQHYRMRAQTVKKAFQVLWNQERKLYMDGIDVGEYQETPWLPNGTGTFYSQHTNTMAVLYGLAPIREEQTIMRRVMEDSSLIQAQPYFYHFIFEALDKAGLFGCYGNRTMRRWKDLVDECAAGLKEVWAGFDCDYSHAWGASPTLQMPSKVLGVQVLEPGFRKIRVRPQLGDLTYARGKIPTPQGILQVEARRIDDKISVEIEKTDRIIIEE